MDIILAMLLLYRPSVALWRLDWRVIATAFVMVAGVGTVYWGILGPRPIGGGSSQEFSTHTIVIDENEWIGVRFPLEKHCDLDSRVMSGNWVVLIYHAGCESCHRAIANYESTANAAAGNRLDAQFAFLALDLESQRGTPKFKNIVGGSLEANHEWIASTPVGLYLQNGTVVKVASGEEAENLRWLK